MNILEYYQMMCKNKTINEIYYSTGDTQTNGLGKIFSFFNTNYRTLLTKQSMEYKGFGKGFEMINSVEGRPYNEWPKYDNNENAYKHHTVRMRKSELFTVKNGVYHKTKRGLVFERMLMAKENVLTDIEKRFICYLLILTGYFSNIPNYIIKRVEKVFKCFNFSGYTDTEILDLQKEFLCKVSNMTKQEMFETDYPYIDNFAIQYNEIDFNKIFRNSSENEKVKLKSYVCKNIEDGNTKCILSHKYVNGGNYTKTTLEESTMILYITKKLVDANINTFDDFINNLISSYKTIYDVDTSKLYNFINDAENVNVFKAIYEKIYCLEDQNIIFEANIKVPEKSEIKKIDTTDIEGIKANNIISAGLKKLVKVNNNYKCIMHDIEKCKYFTSKESKNNYLEIHHFIPREFSNDFEESIENVNNYIPLCPNCHRKIHLAIDSERKHIINYIYNIRKDLLKQDNLIPENEKVDGKDFLDILYEYYCIDKE